MFDQHKIAYLILFCIIVSGCSWDEVTCSDGPRFIFSHIDLEKVSGDCSIVIEGDDLTIVEEDDTIPIVGEYNTRKCVASIDWSSDYCIYERTARCIYSSVTVDLETFVTKQKTNDGLPWKGTVMATMYTRDGINCENVYDITFWRD